MRRRSVASVITGALLTLAMAFTPSVANAGPILDTFLFAAVIGGQVADQDNNSGGNQNCGDSGGSGDENVTAAEAKTFDGNANAALVAKALSGKAGLNMHGLKFTNAQIAGFLGNWSVESHVTFHRAQWGRGADQNASNSVMRQFINNTTRQGIDVGLGVVQWTWGGAQGRATELLDVADRMHKHWYDGAPQLELLIEELSGTGTHNYRSVYEMTKGENVDDCTRDVLAHYEVGPTATLSERQTAARKWYAILQKNPKFSQTGGDSDSSSSSSCQSDSGDAAFSSIGGAPGPGQTRNYGWMCKGAHVCKPGDTGPMPQAAGYQCWWYAETRMWMIHHHQPPNNDAFRGMAPSGAAGDLASGACHYPGWGCSAIPHAGDGVSEKGGALGGTLSVGHVAVVEEVKPDSSGWKVRISEGNYSCDGGWNGYNSRWITAAQFRGQGNIFFYMKSWHH